MFTMVFSKEEKDLLILQGCVFMGEQNMGDKKAYVFKDINTNKNINFEKNKINYINTNDMLF